MNLFQIMIFNKPANAFSVLLLLMTLWITPTQSAASPHYDFVILDVPFNLTRGSEGFAFPSMEQALTLSHNFYQKFASENS